MTTERGHTLDMEGAGAPVPSSNLVVLSGCRCPGSPHRNDWVKLTPKLTNPIGSSVMGAIRATLQLGGTFDDAFARVSSIYMHLGIDEWSFLEGDPPKPVPITPANVDRLLPFGDGGLEVSEAADALYSEDLLAPLAKRMSSSSAPTPTDGSTSVNPPSGSTPSESSTPSSPTSTDGKPSEDPAP